MAVSEPLTVATGQGGNSRKGRIEYRNNLFNFDKLNIWPVEPLTVLI